MKSPWQFRSLSFSSGSGHNKKKPNRKAQNTHRLKPFLAPSGAAVETTAPVCRSNPWISGQGTLHQLSVMDRPHERVFEDTVNQRSQTVSSRCTAVSPAPITTHLKPEESRAEMELHKVLPPWRGVWKGNENQSPTKTTIRLINQAQHKSLTCTAQLVTASQQAWRQK